MEGNSAHKHAADGILLLGPNDCTYPQHEHLNLLNRTDDNNSQSHDASQTHPQLQHDASQTHPQLVLLPTLLHCALNWGTTQLLLHHLSQRCYTLNSHLVKIQP